MGPPYANATQESCKLLKQPTSVLAVPAPRLDVLALASGAAVNVVTSSLAERTHRQQSLAKLPNVYEQQANNFNHNPYIQ